MSYSSAALPRTRCKTSYVNGRYVRHADAAVHIEDRGYQFADGIYEVIAIYDGILLDGGLHYDRLERSLAGLSIPMPFARSAFNTIINQLLVLNGQRNGSVYIQISRGVAKRNHAFPKTALKPAVVITLLGTKPPSKAELASGVKVITTAETRWARRDIKSVSLLPNCLAKQQAVEAGVREIWFIENGEVTEGSSSNSYIVDKSGAVVTAPATNRILGGITRDVLLRIARENGINVLERHFTPDEAKNAAEAFLTSTTQNVLPVVEIDGQKIGSGLVGAVTNRLIALYDAHISSTLRLAA